MGYRLLGLFLWKGGKLYLRHRLGRWMPTRRAALAGLAGLVVAGAAVTAMRRNGELPVD